MKKHAVWKYRVIILFLLFPVFFLSNCSREEKSKKYPVFYDFVENFHLAEVQQEVRLIDFGTSSAHRHMRYGWSTDEKGSSKVTTFVWSSGDKSVFEFFLFEPREIQMTFRCYPFIFPGSPVQSISFAVNGKEIEKVTLEPGSKEYQIVLPRQAVVPGKNRLEFRYAYARAPKDVVPGSGDVRSLGVAWDYIRFGIGTGETRSHSEPQVDVETGKLYIPFRAQVNYYLKLPGGSVLTFDTLTLTGNPGYQMRLALQRKGEDEQILETFKKSEKFRTMPLPGDALQIVRLSFRAVSPEEPFTGLRGVTLVKPSIRTQYPQEVLLGSRRPNIIIYLSDALRADHLGCYGYKKPITPNIDVFAKDAVLFDNAIAQASWTRPSVASLFTGLGPKAHRVNDINDALPSEAVTLAEILRAVGYYTAAFTSNNNIGFIFGFDQGFVDFVDLNEAYIDHVRLHEAHKVRTSHQLLDIIHEHVFDWLAKEELQQPFFIYIHTWGSHQPYDPPPNFRKKFAARVKQPEIGSSPWIKALDANKIPVTETLVKDLISLYDAEIAFNDHKFGVFLQELKQKGFYEETLIIFISDHGEGFYEHEFFSHRNSLYAEALNIPLLLKLPSSMSTAKKRVPSLVQHIDILPTILDYLSVEVPESLQGSSLLHLLSSEEEGKQPRRAFSYHGVRDKQIESVIEDPWKLIRTRRAGSNNSRLQLYNREQDPGEELNVLEKYPEVANYLLSLIEDYEQSSGRRLKPSKVVIDEELKEKLKALGYVQ